LNRAKEKLPTKRAVDEILGHGWPNLDYKRKAALPIDSATRRSGDPGGIAKAKASSAMAVRIKRP
jgi:hypothetical protein